ncbi:2,5-furandicarboxylate decarboxylase 1 [Desulforamulus putei DSM 12395]|uniref:Phenolic acid decarboxylase n=1 Tax=Desulforamulus putei DSM 12395 TaxID=1121429 RepID=A0A1M5CJV9_9FIRM|nr:UbiD family decarboxylase [Desulforamulus putei]SHF55034.1 2,5-furandicarboxylate decarboxylase 1 [Desulforamulus putei DSM 12395]
MRDWLAYLENEGKIKTVSKEISLKFEMPAVIKKLDGKAAVKFKKPKGYNIPVVSGIAYDRDLFAKALGTTKNNVARKISECQKQPIPCQVVTREEAPVMKNINIDDVNLMTLPIPIHHEKDAGHYITAGLLICKDPETGKRNVSIHRLQVFSKNEIGILILPRHLSQLYMKAEKKNEPLDIAIAIGVDPVLLLASQAIVPLGVDELEIANAIKNGGQKLVKCQTVDVEVPAEAEIVLEGKLLPKVRKVEGPFGEFPKYYGPASEKPVIKITAICHRDEPIYHTILPATKEHLLLGGLAREATLYELVKQTVPTVKDVHLTIGGTCRYHAVISIDKKHEGEAKNAMFAAFASMQEVKHVVVVDSDVDIFDIEEVEWAIATRCQMAKDIMLVSGSLGSKLDPSTNDGISDKMGIDATCPLNAPPEKYETIKIPGYEELNIEDYLDNE